MPRRLTIRTFDLPTTEAGPVSYRHLFGPVPSRRLGVSLGVDLVPHKVCSLNCVYCECGKTTDLTLERREYVPFDQVTRELGHFLDNNPLPEYITFSGSGEPTLHSRIGEIINFIGQRNTHTPVALLTNGTLLSDSQLRREALGADLILPSLDAATEGAFHRINRPHSGLDVKDHIRGLVELRQEYQGAIWLEVFILPGYNDDEENLREMKKTLKLAGADRIQLNTLDRPGAVPGLRPASPGFLKRLMEEWDLPGLEIIAAPFARREKASFSEDIAESVYSTISRRPCTLEDLARILCFHPNEVNKYLAVLEADGRVESVSMDRGIFYRTLPNR